MIRFLLFAAVAYTAAGVEIRARGASDFLSSVIDAATAVTNNFITSRWARSFVGDAVQ